MIRWKRSNGRAPGRGATVAFAAVGVACLAAVAAALITQHVFGMQPCPWCVLQRLIFLAIAGVSGLALVWRSEIGRRVAGSLALLLAACGAAAALWQHFRAAASAACKLTFADRVIGEWLGLDSLWPAVFAPRASCADAAVDLLGLPYDFWSLALFLLAGLGTAYALRRAASRDRELSRPV